MNCYAFEVMLCNHASPVLMGLKPSNLISFSRNSLPELDYLLKAYEAPLSGLGIQMEVICRCKNHDMVLFYRPDHLRLCLSYSKVRDMLEEDGYPRNATLDEQLQLLKKRFREKKEFPHEIGLFLGYPYEDVLGFRLNKGNACKMCGYWKVYGDVKQAEIAFTQFDQCREYVRAGLKAGTPIMEILRESKGQYRRNY